MMCGSHSEVQHTRTTVLWPWRTLVKMMMPCSAGLALLLVAELLILVDIGLLKEIVFFQMELKFQTKTSGISTEQEMRWWYIWIAKEVEWRGSTTVSYSTQWMFSRPYTLEYTTQAMVSDIICMLLFYGVSNCKSHVLLLGSFQCWVLISFPSK